jgi:hypothetical protein
MDHSELDQLDAYRHSIARPSADVSYLDIGHRPIARFVHGLATHASLCQHLASR